MANCKDTEDHLYPHNPAWLLPPVQHSGTQPGLHPATRTHLALLAWSWTWPDSAGLGPARGHSTSWPRLSASPVLALQLLTATTSPPAPPPPQRATAPAARQPLPLQGQPLRHCPSLRAPPRLRFHPPLPPFRPPRLAPPTSPSLPASPCPAHLPPAPPSRLPACPPLSSSPSMDSSICQGHSTSPWRQQHLQRVLQGQLTEALFRVWV